MRQRVAIHVVTAVSCLALAIVAVSANNDRYRNDPSFTTKEASLGSQDFQPVIPRPYRIYSLFLGLFVFVSLYGAFASLFEVKDRIRFVIALAFLWAFPGTILSWCVLPVFVGVVLSVIGCVSAMAKKRRKAAWISLGALVFNIVFAIVTIDALTLTWDLQNEMY